MDHTTLNKALFSQRFSELLQASSETTYSLADKLCLSAATISRYANGLMTPKMTTVRAMASIFGVNPAWLSGNSSDKFLTTEPAPTPADPLAAEFAALFSRLSEEQQEFVLAALRGMNDRKD